MASDLLTQYTEAADTDLRNRLVQALAKECATKLNQTNQGDPFYDRYVALARLALNMTNESITFVARALVANGYTNASSDTDLLTAVATYFDVFAKSYDPTIP